MPKKPLERSQECMQARINSIILLIIIMDKCQTIFIIGHYNINNYLDGFLFLMRSV